jgi:adenylate cyclase
MQKYSLGDFAKAREHFERAITCDPAFARAHACLGLVAFHEWNGTSSKPTLLEEAFRFSETALELDPHESKCHLAIGVVCLFRGEHEKANYHLGRAAELNPNDDLIMVEQARYFMYTGQPLNGAEQVRLAMRRNPFFPNWYWNILGRCLHTAQCYEEAVSAFERISTPQFFNHAYMAACHAQLGHEKAARLHADKVLEKKPDFTLSDFAKQLPYRSETDCTTFLEGLRCAGLPD